MWPLRLPRGAPGQEGGVHSWRSTVRTLGRFRNVPIADTKEPRSSSSVECRRLRFPFAWRTHVRPFASLTQDPHLHRQRPRAQAHLQLRQRGTLLLRQGRAERDHRRLLAVLLRPCRQHHLPGHRPGLPTRYQLHDQRRTAGDRQVHLRWHLVLRQDRQ